MNLNLSKFRKRAEKMPKVLGGFVLAMVAIVSMLSTQEAVAQAPYKGSELFVYHMVGKPPYANRTPACMKFVSFTAPTLYCPPPPPPPEDPWTPPSGGGQSDQGGGLVFINEAETKSVMAPPPGGVFDAFDSDIIGLSFYKTNASCTWTGNAARLTVCPTAGSNTIINGFFFEYGVSMTGGGAAGISTPTLKVFVGGVQVYTQTFQSSDRYNGFYAAFPASLNTTAWEGKNVTFEVTDVREHIIDDFAVIGTNNCTGKVCLGNLVWEDTNANGIYDSNEAKRANVKIQIFRDDKDGVFKMPTRDYLFEDGRDGLIAETTTDANGNYNVCVPAGDYFVRVTPDNFNVGKPLSGCFPTFGPSVTGNSDQDNKDHADASLKPAYKGIGVLSSLVTLTVGGEPTTDGNDANTNSTIDFGFLCNANLLLNLGNVVWVDSVKIDGIKGAGEPGIDGVVLELYIDTNNNGSYEATDTYAGTTTTAGGGIYNFTGLMPGNYILKAPSSNFKFSPAGALRGFYPSPGADPATDPDNDIDNDDNGIVTASNDIVTQAITLALNTEPTNDGDGSQGNLGLDIAVVKDPRCTEYYTFGFNSIWNGYNYQYVFVGMILNDDYSVRKTYTFPFTYQSSGELTVFYEKEKGRFILRKNGEGVFALKFDIDGNYTKTDLSAISIDGISANSNKLEHRSSYGARSPITGKMYRVTDGSTSVDAQPSYLTEIAAPDYIETRLTASFQPNSAGNNNNHRIAFDKTGVLYDIYSIYRVSQGDYLTTISKRTIGGAITASTTYTGSVAVGFLVHDATNSVYVAIDDKILRWPLSLVGTPTTVATGITGSDIAFGESKNELIVLNSGTNSIVTSYTILANGELSFNKMESIPFYTGIAAQLIAIPCGGGTGTPPPPPPAPLKLGNRVWSDVNNNGLIDGTETGITNVGVVLYKDSNGDGVFDRLTDTRVDSTTTDATGYYLFDNLLNGDYFVWIPNLNFSADKALFGKYSSTPSIADPNTDIDNDDNGINPVMPKSHINDGVFSGKVTLAYGAEPTTDGDDANGNMTVDFGFYTPNPAVDNILRLGNRVWNDANNNIKIDAGEAYFDGVKLTLLKDDGDLLFDATKDLVQATTTTAGGGFYLFDKLLPGFYYVRVDKENFDAGKVLEKYRSSTGYYGANTCFDSTDHGNEQAFNWWVDGVLTSYISMELNQEPPATVDTDDENGNLVMDFGFYRPVRLGNRVWKDTNKNGKRDTGEPDINGVMVNVYKDDGDGIFDLSKDTYAGMRTTQDSGYYNFHDLVQGSYFVMIPSSNFANEGVLKNFVSTPGVVGENPAANNQDHGIDNTNPIMGGIVSQIVVLAYDQEPPATVDTDNADGNFTIDFGFVPDNRIDLALKKILATGQARKVTIGSTVKFTIKVYNQGAVPATNIQVTDYIPTGLTLADANWTATAGKATLNTPIASLAAGDSTSRDISFTVGSPTTAIIRNSAEISSATGTDVDSTPDNDANNDGTAQNDEIYGQRKLNVIDDEDDADYEEIYPYIDLALTKKLATGQAVTVERGASVTFTINVINQGTVDATNVQLTDYVPAGLIPNDANWTNMGGGKYQLVTPIASIPAGQTVSRNFTFTVGNVEGNITNYAEISSIDGGDDIDSTPDSDNNNDGTPVDDVVTGNHKTTPSADEDDNDLAVITVKRFDLALKKTLATGQAATVNPNEDVNFTITVYNQGTIDASNIQVTDYIPTNMTLNDANWTAVGSKATLKTPIANLAGGQSTTVSITLRVNAGVAATSIVNFAEVSSATGGTDVDSNPDTDGTNDGTPIDDEITQNGKTGGDEDDHDLASVSINASIVDVALRKTLATGQSRTVARGESVTFTITVFNQGNVAVTNLRVYDYIPTGLTLNDADWTASGTTIAYTKVNFASIAPGDSAKIDITFTVAATAVGAITNAAEVVSFTGGTDIDSTPNGTATDDGVPKDNVTNEDGKNTTGDEDDHDIETIVITDGPRFDLALRKTTSKTAVRSGDTVTFTISVYNQGNTDASNVQLTDYIPTQLTLADANWTNNAGKATLNTPIALVAAGATVTRDITFTVNAGITGTVTNTAEISAATGGTDIDSTPDDLNTNDGTVKNDVITEDHKTTSTLDEDDHDTEPLTVTKNVDIALRKTLAAGQSRQVTAGSTAKFTVTVYNQGTETLTNIRVYDYIPTGLTLNDANWTASATMAFNKTYIATLAPGDSAKIDINFTVDAAATGTITNAVEVSSFTGGTDVDSTPDNTSTNDGTVKNDVIDEDYKANTTDSDQDDHDIESIEIITNPIFDLALTKTVSNSVITPGQSITFNVNVINQGNTTATNVQVTDYIPAGLTLNDANWTLTGSKATLNTPIATLIAGETVTKTITFTVNASATGNITNYAEISAATGGTDIDSTPDADNGNDGTPQDDITNGDHKTNPADDEDDHDFAVLVIPEVPVFDLALTKKLAAGQSASVVTGGTVKFTVSIINQGNVDATAVQVTDFIPTGLTLNDANWTAVSGKATLNTPIATLAAGATVTRDITFTVGTVTGTITNTAEISAATGGTDKDSTPDADGTNDGTPRNDVINEDRKADSTKDEDDSDPESITVTTAPVFDLALTKKLAAGQSASVVTGGTVKFTVSIINQGNVDATAVQVTDFIPTGLTLNDANWTAVSGKATLNTPIATLAAGATVTRDITFTVGTVTGTITNTAEISAATGGTDKDSTPDADGTNDGTPRNDVINEDRKADSTKDEDDSDPESITVTTAPVFDLALTKKLAAGQSASVVTGGTVKFTVSIINQGNVDATAVQVTDFIPTGLTLNDANWTAVSGKATLNTPIATLAAGATVTRDITFTVGTVTGTITNTAEISAATGGTDKDSTPDADGTNDGTPKNDVVNEDRKADSTKDEDDSDPESITVTTAPVFDLALTKKLAAGQSASVVTGGTVKFTVSIINQGNVDATAVQVIDFIPTGLTLNDANWTAASGGKTTLVTPIASLAAGATVTRDITFTVGTVTGTITNTAEISAATGGTDIDSTPDADNTNDGTPQNDVVTGDHKNNSAQDEDDHDPEPITVTAAPCITQNAGPDITVCLPKTTANFVDASAGYEWVAGAGNPSAATINTTTGVVSGMTAVGTYKFRMQKTGEATCFDEVQVTVTNGDVPIVLCNNGSTSYNLVAPSNLTNVIWYNMAGTQVGTGTTLTVTSNTTGLSDGSEAFYYIGVDGSASGCDVELCCPVKFLTQTCCPTPNCVGVTIIKN